MSQLVLQTQVNGSTRYEPVFRLEGRRYGFRFYTNATDNLWYFDLFDPDTQTDTLLGLRIVAGIDLLYRYRYKGVAKIPPGYLLVADLNTLKYDSATQTFTGQIGLDPPLDGFETGLYQLVYVTSDDRR